MTTLADIKRALAASHRLDASRGVFVAGGAKPFAYSDGAGAEAHVAAAIRSARDLAVGSTELASQVRDWPSLYHLSPVRQNLLRPLPALGGAILEIGAGCGAITRYLGESGAAVLAVEGSLERATIAASRCRDLPNVVVACANFDDLALDLRFDLVTLIGVLEYSRMFISGPDPVQAMLGRAAALLADDGLLALAIENQLGLKYLAGAREDHTGVAFYGVTGQYGPATAVTFGEAELRQRLAQAGFASVTGLYPFPDYKLPAVIVTERGFADPAFNVADLVATTSGRRHPREGPFAYSESLARTVFARNGLGAATANSFLFLAGKSPRAGALPDREALAFSYSAARERAFAKETRTVRAGDAIRVKRRALYAVKPPHGAGVRQRFADEDYVDGEVLFGELERIIGRRGWSVDDLAAGVRPWVDLLRTQAGVAATLPPEYFDCTPFNVIRRRGDNALVPFDLEWQLDEGEAPTVERVAFRGLWNSLARMDGAAAPAGDTPTDIASLTLETLKRLGIAIAPAQVLEWVRGEYLFSNAVGAKSEEVPAFVPPLRVAGIGDHDSAALPRVASGLGSAEHRALEGDFRIQVYLAAGQPGYSEANSVSVAGGGNGPRIVAHLAFPAHDVGYAGFRVDPMDIPGLIRLERVAVTTAASELVWETRRCAAADFVNVGHFRDLSRIAPGASGTVWFADGADPNFELPLPAAVLASLKGGGAIHIEMSRLEAPELSAIVTLAEMAGALPAKKGAKP